MSISSVAAMYFSPTGTTRRVVSRIAQVLSDELCRGAAAAHRDFTLPRARKERASFLEGSLVVFGVPVYAGRVPKVLLEHIGTVRGDGALAVAVVVYGNRHYDDALIELADLLEARGFLVVAAAAFIGEHSYSSVLARGRPDDDDLALATDFANRVATKLSGGAPIEKVVPAGNRPYRELPVSVDLGKARPQTSSACQSCRECIDICPMGSIDPDDVSTIGVCIRCNACVKTCPAQARSFSDGAYLSVKRWLETHCTQRRTPELFL
jgi:NAD-dependent dihydropyrimidine dehydrogenase PreA subunit